MRKVIVALLTLLVTCDSSRSAAFQVLHTFTNSPDGSVEFTAMGLVLAGETLFGATAGGGVSGGGTVFKINTDGSGYAVIKSVPPGSIPITKLMVGGDTIYGSTFGGGDFGYGTIFSISTNGSNFIALKHFDGTNGANPNINLILDAGIIFGTTTQGGVSNVGTIFRINTDGTGFVMLREFLGDQSFGVASPDGSYASGVLLDGGVLYGITTGGGSNGLGTIYRILTNGSEYAVIKEFSQADDSPPYMQPYPGLTIHEGILYGAASKQGGDEHSIIFRIGTNGSGFEILKDFPLGSKPQNPSSQLLINGGRIYGQTRQGGETLAGTVFRMNLDGTEFTILKGDFSLYDGFPPAGGLVPAGGSLFGVTDHWGAIQGGSGFGRGTLFKLTPAPSVQARTNGGPIGTSGPSFKVTGLSNQSVVVEACSDLLLPAWISLQTNQLNDGSLIFTDPDWTNFPVRIYRVGGQP